MTKTLTLTLVLALGTAVLFALLIVLGVSLSPRSLGWKSRTHSIEILGPDGALLSELKRGQDRTFSNAIAEIDLGSKFGYTEESFKGRSDRPLTVRLLDADGQAVAELRGAVIAGDTILMSTPDGTAIMSMNWLERDSERVREASAPYRR